MKGNMVRLFLLMFGVQLSYQLECFQCKTVSVGRFSGAKTTHLDKCGGYEDLGMKVTCEDPQASAIRNTTIGICIMTADPRQM